MTEAKARKKLGNLVKNIPL